MRSIGIPVADREECVVALNVAFGLGKRLGSDIIGYHMRPNRQEGDKIDLSEFWNSGELAHTAWPLEDESKVEAAAVSARHLFESMARQHGYALSSRRGTPEKPHAVYRETVGAPGKLIPLFGPTNDLMVVSRPRSNSGAKAWVVMMSALLHSPVPLLVLPQKEVKVDCARIAIAWNRGRSEVLLVHGTLPLLKTAEDIVFISVGRDHRHGPSEKNMCDFLKGHGIKARTRKVVRGNTGKVLMDTVQEEKADLLLSGAYTRSRLREMIFGGVSKYLIKGTDFPVVLMHV